MPPSQCRERRGVSESPSRRLSDPPFKGPPPRHLLRGFEWRTPTEGFSTISEAFRLLDAGKPELPTLLSSCCVAPEHDGVESLELDVLCGAQPTLLGASHACVIAPLLVRQHCEYVVACSKGMQHEGRHPERKDHYSLLQVLVADIAEVTSRRTFYFLYGSSSTSGVFYAHPERFARIESAGLELGQYLQPSGPSGPAQRRRNGSSGRPGRLDPKFLHYEILIDRDERPKFRSGWPSQSVPNPSSEVFHFEATNLAVETVNRIGCSRSQVAWDQHH